MLDTQPVLMQVILAFTGPIILIIGLTRLIHSKFFNDWSSKYTQTVTELWERSIRTMSLGMAGLVIFRFKPEWLDNQIWLWLAASVIIFLIGAVSMVSIPKRIGKTTDYKLSTWSKLVNTCLILSGLMWTLYSWLPHLISMQA